MSAYMCSPNHIAGVVDVLLALDADTKDVLRLEPGEDAGRLFHLLMAENAASIEARYPRDWKTMLIGDSLEAYTYSTQWKPNLTTSGHTKPKDVAEALKAVDCLTYQSCEHRGWGESRAFAILTLATVELQKRLSEMHPAYAAAAWGFRGN